MNVQASLLCNLNYHFFKQSLNFLNLEDLYCEWDSNLPSWSWNHSLLLKSLIEQQQNEVIQRF